MTHENKRNPDGTWNEKPWWTVPLDKIEMQSRAQIEALRAIADELRRLRIYLTGPRTIENVRITHEELAEMAQAGPTPERVELTDPADEP